MKRIKDLTIPIENDKNLKMLAATAASLDLSDIKWFDIVKKSIDARKKNDIKFIYTIDLSTESHKRAEIVFDKAKKQPENPPIVVGSGPAGIFCALYLAEAGLCPIIFERGSEVDKRKEAVSKFWATGDLNQNSNAQFGEGGAGTFSDGKLTTQIKSPYKDEVLELFIQAGAPEEIRFVNKAHIGTDNLVNVVKRLRERIQKLGGKFFFETKVTDIIIEKSITKGIIANDKSYYSDTVILAIGHSARDTYFMLKDKGISLEQKEFSVGFRIEHPQKLINLSQYGNKYCDYKALGKADYKLVSHTKTGRNVYTFCMCPGGKVVAAASEEKHLVTNGMSCFSRNGENANSAILCNIKKEDMGTDNPLQGILLQRQWESKAYDWGGKNYYAPVQLVKDFLQKKQSTRFGRVTPTYTPGTTFAPLHTFFNQDFTESFMFAINDMQKTVNYFNMDEAVLTAVETRSSSPVRILRDELLQSTNTKGLYPAGEGSGYAGGIMSSAIDGIKIAKGIINTL